MKNDRYIAKQVILAQIASDGAKGDIQRGHYILKTYSKKGYDIKDRCIFNAIKTICKSINSKFRFHVKKSKDYSRSYIVYFNVKVYGNRHQISFHSFNRGLERYINEKCSTRWDKKSSQETARLLNEAYDLFKDYR